MPVRQFLFACFVAVDCLFPMTGAYAAMPDDFPRFIVPGKEREMESLRSLFWLHYQSAAPAIALWDEWLANAMLWPARGEGAELAAMRMRGRNALAGRPMNAEGYVHTQQHDGLAHAEGCGRFRSGRKPAASAGTSAALAFRVMTHQSFRPMVGGSIARRVEMLATRAGSSS